MSKKDYIIKIKSIEYYKNLTIKNEFKSNITEL